MEITNIISNDGSRHFLSVPERVQWEELRESVGKLNGAIETNYISDGVTEMWLDFTYKEQKFTVNNQFGEFWFFAEDAGCPEDLLKDLASYFQASLV